MDGAEAGQRAADAFRSNGGGGSTQFGTNRGLPGPRACPPRPAHA